MNDLRGRTPLLPPPLPADAMEITKYPDWLWDLVGRCDVEDVDDVMGGILEFKQSIKNVI
jgi:hypothetical protein